MWSSAASARDNWGRLVAAVMKREEIWQLCHQPSRSPSISTISSTDDFSQRNLSFSSTNLESHSVPPSPLLPPKNLAVSEGNYMNESIGTAFHHLKSIQERLRGYTFRELQDATDNFSSKNILESGNSGKVYKGRLADGKLVAVKRLKEERTTGGEPQFQMEIDVMRSTVRHPNLLRLHGFCKTLTERLLVYPYMSYGSVASLLREREPHSLSWAIRKRIALGAARGLAYLHEGIRGKKIIHRNINAANIFFDGDFEAVVGDFGWAIMPEHNAPVEVSVPRTAEHIPPECYVTYRVSEKYDVYCYGLFLLELISGQTISHLHSLALDEDVITLRNWVKRLYKESKWKNIVDANCEGNYMEDEDVVMLLFQIALLCTPRDPWRRPKMSEVVKIIEIGDGLSQRCQELFMEENYPYPYCIIDDD